MRFVASVIIFSGVLFAATRGGHECLAEKDGSVPPGFFEQCAFVSVDFQESKAPVAISDDQLPKGWRAAGFTADDVNAANAYAWDTALPNAVKVSDACRDLGLPRIFIHWGYLFENAMDLDPEVRKVMQDEYGTDYARYSGHIRQPGSQPASAFNIQPDDYVLPKAAQDAFGSCNIEFVLRNLGVKNIIFVGGHTNSGGCLGKTARSAMRLGYTALVIEDATFNARESTRKDDIAETGYTHVLTTDAFLRLVQSVRQDR